MNEPVRVVVKIVARPDTVAAVRSVVLVLAEKSRNEPGCTVYDVVQDLGDPAIFLLIEAWESVAALEAHHKTPHFHEAVVGAGPLLAQPFEASRYREIS